MNLSALLAKRVAEGRPVRVGLIGAGKFGSMILAQARLIDGLHVVGIADLNIAKARESLHRVGWQDDEYDAPDLETAYKDGRTCIVDDAFALASFHGVECIVEATGHPIAGIRHALSAIEHNKNPGHGQRRSRRAGAARSWQNVPAKRASSTPWPTAISLR